MASAMASLGLGSLGLNSSSGTSNGLDLFCESPVFPMPDIASPNPLTMSDNTLPMMLMDSTPLLKKPVL